MARPELWEEAKASGAGLGLFVRGLVGMDREATKQALNTFTSAKALTGNQIEFVNLVVDHLTTHGAVPPALLYESPFTDVNPRGPGGGVRVAAGGRVGRGPGGKFAPGRLRDGPGCAGSHGDIPKLLDYIHRSHRWAQMIGSGGASAVENHGPVRVQIIRALGIRRSGIQTSAPLRLGAR